MDAVIARIMEIERQCAADIEQAEVDYAERIEEHKHILEGKKIAQYALITSAESARLTQAVEKAKRQSEAVSAAFRKDSESRLQDPVLKQAIKDDIISILLAS